MPTDDASYQELIDRIHYSERYSDDEYEYRHVQLPRQMLKLIPKDVSSPIFPLPVVVLPPTLDSPTDPVVVQYFEPDSNVLRLLTEDEWRGIGITQSLGWEHYEVHHPEPHILLFRREKDYQSKYGNAQR
ncbi:hypothetical protein JCM5296_003342 [Sporobolomyces johnsonii]